MGHKTYTQNKTMRSLQRNKNTSRLMAASLLRRVRGSTNTILMAMTDKCDDPLFPIPILPYTSYESV